MNKAGILRKMFRTALVTLFAFVHFAFLSGGLAFWHQYLSERYAEHWLLDVVAMASLFIALYLPVLSAIAIFEMYSRRKAGKAELNPTASTHRINE